MRGSGSSARTRGRGGVATLWDDIAPDNPAIAPFLEQGFVEDHRGDEAVYLRKDLS